MCIFHSFHTSATTHAPTVGRYHSSGEKPNHPTIDKHTEERTTNLIKGTPALTQMVNLDKFAFKIGKMDSIIVNNKERIDDICKGHHVETLYTFGSVNTDQFTADSDIDLIVTFDMNKVSIDDYADVYFDMLFSLEELLNREVDLVTERSIKNPYFKDEISKNRILIYKSSAN